MQKRRTYRKKNSFTVREASKPFSSILPTADVDLTISDQLMRKITGQVGSGEIAGSIEHRIQMSLELRNLWAAWIKSYVQRGDFNGFKTKWKWARTVITLQNRLLVEQILFDFGNPWKGLVTGFGSI